MSGCGKPIDDSPLRRIAAMSASECPPGAPCVDVSQCTSEGGTCLDSCSFGCCCTLNVVTIYHTYIDEPVYVNDWPTAVVESRVDSSTNEYDFFAGIKYVDGPTSSIGSEKCSSISKGGICYEKGVTRDVGQYVGFADSLNFTVAGRYTIMFVAGYIAGGTLVETSFVTKYVDVYLIPTSLTLTVQQL